MIPLFFCADCSLSVHQAFVAAKGVTEWKSIGIALGISESKLDEIGFTYPADTRQCIIQMMSFWIESDSTCSWEKLCTAFIECGKGELANEIRTKFGESTLCDVHL